MKKLLAVLFAVLIISAVPAAAPLRVASGKKALMTIVLPANANKLEKMAAEDLRSYLNRMTGANFSIAAESSAELSNAIYVGQSAYAARQKIDFAKFEHEEHLIRQVGSNLILTGGRPAGSFYAVWELLNRLGCYAVAPDQDAIPKKIELTLPADINIQRKPSFWGRLIFDNFPQIAWKSKISGKALDSYFRWTLRNRINGKQDAKFYPYYRGKGLFVSHTPQWHSLNCYVPAEKYFDDHPEYFFMNEQGVRAKPQMVHFNGCLCMSNPDVARITLQSLREMIIKDRKTYGPDEFPVIYDISILDATPYICYCPQCQAITKEEGNETGLLLRYINTVAREIRKEYPDIIIRTFGYSATRNAPLKTMPESNVQIFLCDMFNVSDPFRPLEAPVNRNRPEYFYGWQKTTKRLAIWDYWNIGGMGHFFIPPRVETVFDAIAPDLRFFKKLGAESLFLEAEADPASPQNFIMLNYFVANHLMNDLDQDPENLARIFLNAYYGPAAGEMKEIFMKIRQGVAAEKSHQDSMNVQPWTFADKEFILWMYSRLKQIAASLPAGSVHRRRVESELVTPIWSMIAQRGVFEKLLKAKGISMEQLIGECRKYARQHIRRYACSAPEMIDKQFEDRLFPFVLNLPRPEKFKDVPDDDFKMIAYPNFNGVKILGSAIVDDPESIQGKALKAAHKDPEWHGVNKLLPAMKTDTGDTSKFKFYTTKFYLENFRQPGTISMTVKEVPQDEKYHWYRIPGPIELRRTSYFWGQGWAIQANTSHWYALTDGNPKDNTWDDVWFSAKFTGPAYVKGSKKENAIWIDMVVITRGKK